MLQAPSLPQLGTLPRPQAPSKAALADNTTATTAISNRVANSVRILLFVAFVLMLIIAIHPGLRAKVRGLANHDARQVLSTVHGNLVGNGVELTVAKVRAHDTLFLEIYEPKVDGGQRLMERIELPDHKDGYFNFNGEATNLAIDDVNGDGRLEILVPTFDQNLIGHLNIYRYDSGSGAFTRSVM